MKFAVNKPNKTSAGIIRYKFEVNILANKITAPVIDKSYAGISSTTALSFTSQDTGNPYLTSTTPAHQATGIAVNTNIVLNFSENVDVESGNITIKKTSDDTSVETIDVTGNTVTGSGSTQITINPSSLLVLH